MQDKSTLHVIPSLPGGMPPVAQRQGPCLMNAAVLLLGYFHGLCLFKPLLHVKLRLSSGSVEDRKKWVPLELLLSCFCGPSCSSCKGTANCDMEVPLSCCSPGQTHRAWTKSRPPAPPVRSSAGLVFFPRPYIPSP